MKIYNNPYNYTPYAQPSDFNSRLSNMSFNQIQQQPTNSMVWVNGLNGAKAYQMTPNSSVALFDQQEPKFYIKSTDGAGFPTIKEYVFLEQNEEKVSNDYITREEFENRIKELSNNEPDLSDVSESKSKHKSNANAK